MDLTKSQVTLFWNLCKDKSWHVLCRPTLRWVPLQVRAFYWRCRDSGIYRVLQKRLSNLTLAEVAENLRQPQGSQEEEEGSGKGNFAMSKNTSRLFWKNTSLLFCKNSSLIFCKNTSWLFRPGGVWRDRWGRRSPYSGGAIAGSERETQLGEKMARIKEVEH